MSMWTWRYEAPDGSPVTGAELPRSTFSSQADAESWIGETWHELLENGVDQVVLLQAGQKVYGPMSLRPLE